jgi:enoyl-CoA hydratase/carnithine racemase
VTAETHSGPPSTGPVTAEFVSDHVALVEYRRPPENFLDDDSLSGLAGVLEGVAIERRCRCVVLATEGKHFSAGGRFEPDGEPGDAARRRLYEAAVRIFAVEVPIVAAIQGAAVGGGLGLALAADFRVATPESRFVANFSRLGYHHGFGLSVTLPRLIGYQRALELLLTGRRVKGEEALALGLCDRLVAVGQLRDAAIELASEVAASAPMSLRAIRATMRRGLVAEIRLALEVEQAAQAVLKRSRDFEEGVRASAERREPRFTGE